MSILSLDLGEKRIGVAISKSGIIAEPYAVLENNEKFLEELKKICLEEEIKKIVIGLPKSLSGKINPQEEKIRATAEKIKNKLRIAVAFVDESYTTKIAESRFGSKVSDEEAAVIILEGYLNQESK